MAPPRDPRVFQKQRIQYRGFIQINVGTGDSQEKFDVHEALLTARSRFFQKALSGNWKEAEDRVVNLPEDDPALFADYIHVLYTGDTPGLSNPETISNGGESTRMLCKLCVLAEKLDDVGTKNTVIDALLCSLTKPQTDGNIYLPGRVSVGIIYDGTPEGSPARRLMTDLYAYRYREECLKTPSAE